MGEENNCDEKSSKVAYFQSVIKRKRFKSLGGSGAKSEDEGFESPSSPTENGAIPTIPTQNFEPERKAPLAGQEDLEETEKHEAEGTKEEMQALSVS